jgi:predicted DCC family thiol-disulfide oxidoreductase YuxK
MNRSLPPSAAREPQVTVWFDGACVLCNAEIALYRRLDARRGRVAFVDLTGPDSCPLDRAQMLERFHARLPDGRIVDGMEAFGAMWRAVTPFQPLGWLMQVPLLRAGANRLYAGFLRVRPRLQRWLNRRAHKAPPPGQTR